MKKSSYIIVVLQAFFLLGSCKKDANASLTPVSFNVINATNDVANMAISFSPVSLSYRASKTYIPISSSLEFGLPSGLNSVNLVSSADTSHTFLLSSFELISGNIYSFYIAGQKNRYDTLMMKDNIPTYPDSSSGARFINLVQDSQPVNVVLQGNNVNDFSNLAYKKISTFKKYSAIGNIVNNGGYNFNITDASGNVLATFNWIPTVFRDNTMVITGLVANGSVNVFPVNNF